MAEEKKLINHSELLGHSSEGQDVETEQPIIREASLSQSGVEADQPEELTSTVFKHPTESNDDIDTQPVQSIMVEGEPAQTTQLLEAEVLMNMINPTDLSQTHDDLEGIFRLSSEPEVKAQ